MTDPGTKWKIKQSVLSENNSTMMDASYFQHKPSAASLVEPLKQLEKKNLMVQLTEEKQQARKISMF